LRLARRLMQYKPGRSRKVDRESVRGTHAGNSHGAATGRTGAIHT
jgi:hypothetical protein